MNRENESLGSAVAQAAAAASKRPGAAIVVQGESTGLRNELGGLERARAAGSMSDAQVDAQQRRLLATALDRFQAISAAGDGALAGVLFPPPPAPPPPSDAERVTAVLDQLRGSGVSITAHRDGAVSVSPASRLPIGLREMLTELRGPIAAALRSDVLVIPPAATTGEAA